MITITARINISESGGTITSVSSNYDPNNASGALTNVIGKKTASETNPFMLGVSGLGGGETYDSVPYYIGRELSDSNGNFATPYTIKIKGSSINSLIIVFDKANGRHPKTIRVNGTDYTDDDAQFEIALKSPVGEANVVINNWNAPNYPLIIGSIYSDINIDVDRRNLISFDGSIMDRESAEYPSYGIISNSASLTFMDYDGQALDLIQQKILHSGISISIMLNNTITKTQEPIALTHIRELRYDNDNRQVSLTLKDNLEDWQEINVESVPYDFDNTEENPFSALYKHLHGITKTKGFDMQSYGELDGTTKGALASSKIKYYFLESGSLWDSWQKLCEALQLHIYVNESGKIVCQKELCK